MMKAIRSVVAVLAGVILSTLAMASSNSDEAIRERIQPVGSACIQGEECAAASGAATASASGPRSGEEVYNASCGACHGVGVLGAPKKGTSDWAPRLEKGLDTLLANAISGINSMPPKGTCGNCSDEELSAAIEFMSKF
ncbi:c-type cytochrome [Litoribrevibacter albus]|uniref:Cytochrome c n=1 Tax=Litoribrevibacter albus TaxID=1473156 RepID=A0AA37SCZ9_9GAMM|nr:c-type cytochrome [Litoribrevibacter albus]GLQ32525.1 cytochrome c [Litoribrevibacter albus]